MFQAYYKMICAVLDQHRDLEGLEEVLIIKSVYAISLEIFFDLVVFGDNTDTEDHRKDDGNGAQVLRATKLSVSVEETIFCSVV